MEDFDIRDEVNAQRLPVTIEPESSVIAWLNVLRISGRPVPKEAFAAIPDEPINGSPIGRVNYHRGHCDGLPEGSHLHLLWIYGASEVRQDGRRGLHVGLVVIVNSLTPFSWCATGMFSASSIRGVRGGHRGPSLDSCKHKRRRLLSTRRASEW